MKMFGQSFDEIRKSIEEWIQSLPDYVAWKDFVETSSGQTIIDLVASLGEFLQFNTAFARQEVYPNTARLRTSLVNLACAFGYSVNRPCCAELNVEFVANVTKRISKFEVIGSVGSAPLCLKEDAYVRSGQTYTLRFLVGEWKKVQLDPIIRDFGYYLIEDEIDNNYVIFKVNGMEIELTKEMEWMDENTAAEITTPFGIAIWLGDGELGYKIPSLNSIVEFEYVSPKEISEISEVSLQIGTVNSFELISSYVPEDSIFKLTRVITGYRAARRMAVTEEGHRYITISYPGIIDAYAYRDPEAECCQVNIVYLKEDKSLLNDTEKAGLLDYIYKYALVGVTYAIEDPTPHDKTFEIVVYTEPDTDTDALDQKITDYFEGLSKTLGVKVYIANIVKFIESLSGVTRCYIHTPTSDFVLDHKEYLNYTLNITYEVDDGELDHYGV